ncbi:S-adenosyl-L-methionine-dependent methyltransferase [Leptodontidium sp. MPI-SDFR-AT-0119]|nr:S-adenosyl-L-methionine-dependent methyltransferase [Leptodontidium sp. MPI-SDFR-AT-0119]
MAREEELIELSFPQYWDERYRAEQNGQGESESYEWFRDFVKLKPFFDKYLPAGPKGCTCHILHLGCGNTMQSKYTLLNTQWVVMDVRALSLPTASVDIAIDKGTLDAFIHGSLWDPPDDVRANVGKYVDEVARVLRPGGAWLYITYRQPHFMRPLIERPGHWTVDVEILKDPDGAGGFEYFGFVMRKHSEGVLTSNLDG